MITNVPKPAFHGAGLTIPSEYDIYHGVIADHNAAFGVALNPSVSTPQGQLASSETAIIGAFNDFLLHLANQFDPSHASGRWQDALGSIYFLDRFSAIPTVVPCICSGLTGTMIPDGAIARDNSGNAYAALASGVIDASGTVAISFACAVAGPIPCPAGTLTIINQAIPGWDSIHNPSDGILGRLVENRAAFENRRSSSVANNSAGMLGSIRGAILKLPGVIDCYVYSNDSSNLITVQGCVLGPNSIHVIVAGGDADAIANEIHLKKMPGCAMNGATQVTITATEGYTPPYPSYLILFDYANPLPVSFNVKILKSKLVPSDAIQKIQNAIIGAFGGEDEGAKIKIAAELLASRFYAPIAMLGAWAQIIDLKIGIAGNANGLSVLPNLNQIPTTSANLINVAFDHQ